MRRRAELARNVNVQRAVAAGIVAGLLAAMPGGFVRRADAASAQDVRRVGLPFLYEALFAVANCPNVALDPATFEQAARLYLLRPEDLSPSGQFASTLAALDAEDRVRLDDDHDAFCSMSRLSFAVPHGILHAR